MTRFVVAGVDGSEQSLAAAEWAACEASLRHLPLRLMHASPPRPRPLPAGAHAGAWAEGAEAILARAVFEVSRRHPEVPVTGNQVADEATGALVSAGENASLVVAGSRGAGGFPNLLMGSVALRAAARVACPFALVPPPEDGRGTAAQAREGAEVVLGIDARDPADEVLDFAFEAAQRRGTQLRAIHAWSMPLPATAAAAQLGLAAPGGARSAYEENEIRIATDAVRRWREKYPSVAVLVDVLLLGAAQALVAASTQAQLLVVGRGAAGGLGSVTHAVLHHASCPVVVVPKTY